MADGPGQAVDYSFLIFMDMAMGMGNAVGMEPSMIVFMTMFVRMIMVMAMLVMMFSHKRPSLLRICLIILCFYLFRKPLRGMLSKKINVLTLHKKNAII